MSTIIKATHWDIISNSGASDIGISCDSDSFWIIDANNFDATKGDQGPSISNLVSKNNGATFELTGINGQAVGVAVGTYLDPWFVNYIGNVYHYSGENFSWLGPKNASAYDIGVSTGGAVYFLGRNSHVYKFTDENNFIELTPNSIADDQTRIITPGTTLFDIMYNQNYNTGPRIAAGPGCAPINSRNETWVVDKNGGIWKIINGTWSDTGNSFMALDIAVGPNEEVWAVSVNTPTNPSNVWKFDLENNIWIDGRYDVGGNITRISVAANGLPMVVTETHNTVRCYAIDF